MGQERAGAEWQSSNNSRYTAVEHGNVFHRRNVLLFLIVQMDEEFDCYEVDVSEESTA